MYPWSLSGSTWQLNLLSLTHSHTHRNNSRIGWYKMQMKDWNWMGLKKEEVDQWNQRFLGLWKHSNATTSMKGLANQMSNFCGKDTVTDILSVFQEVRAASCAPKISDFIGWQRSSTALSVKFTFYPLICIWMTRGNHFLSFHLHMNGWWNSVSILSFYRLSFAYYILKYILSNKIQTQMVLAHRFYS